MERKRMNGRKKHLSVLGGFAALLLLLTAGCTSVGTGKEVSGNYAETGFLPATPGNYDSLDTAIFVSKDVEAKTVRFYNTEVGRFYTLNYDGATTYADKYAQALSLEQVKPGALVDISFMRGRRRLNSLQLNGQGFSYTGVENLSLTEGVRRITLMGEEYTLDPNALILTADGPGEAMDLNPVDVLSISGMGHTVYALAVERGHGYLRLSNDEHFIGGFVGIGENRVYQITQDMLLAVPEGVFDVTVSHKGSSGTERVNFERGKELTLDAGKWVSAPKYGGILFITVPLDTQIFIDGEAVDHSKEVSLSYGIHRMIAKADGYASVTRYIRVAEPLAKLNVTLTEGGSTSSNTASANEATPTPSPSPTPTETPSASENSVSGNSSSENSASGNSGSDNGDSGAGDPLSGEGSVNVVSPGEFRVYIDAPEGVEVYKDGSYIGITPLSFKKAEGSCVITLRKEGCQTRSYTIVMDGEEKDVNYSFSELMPIN
ncbi:MAG: PEGA domain-containing protein [Lachnospiraceae bacterium]|nr:PEGA domain-containing protein [Lachnospiraceae bacterium]